MALDTNTKRILVEYLQEIFDRYKVTTSSNPGDTKIVMSIGNKSFTINTQKNRELGTRGVLTR
jgi:hypothetical protein